MNSSIPLTFNTVYHIVYLRCFSPAVQHATYDHFVFVAKD